MKGVNILVFLLVLAIGVSFLLSRKKNEGSKPKARVSTEKVVEEDEKKVSENYSQEPPVPEYKEDDENDTPLESIVARSSDPLEMAERRLLRNDPAVGEFSCDNLDKRLYCQLFDVPKKDDLGILIGKDLEKIAVKARAEAQYQEANKILEDGFPSREEIWNVAFYLFIRQHLNRESLPEVNSSLITIHLVGPEGDAAAAIFPPGGLGPYLKFFEEEYPGYLQSKGRDFLVESRKYIRLQFGDLPSEPAQDIPAGE